MKMTTGRSAAALLAVAFASMTGIANAAIPASERDALVNIYTSTGGAAWANATNWNGAAGTECTWFGVTCDAAGDHVTGIALPANHMQGPLPALDALTELRVLDVHSNDCVFSEPPGVCHEDPGSNHLEGPVPPLAGLAHFQRLYAHYAGFTGPMPSLSGMTTLITLDVSNNLVNGPFPSLDGLDALEDFLVSDTTFVGSIPPLTAPNLRNFDVSGMQLDGTIPPLNQLTHLETFRARNTTLTGSIPSLAGLANLNTFDVALSLLDGAIGSLDGTTNLVTFDANYNRLTGPIPSLAGLTHLSYFDVHANHLSGSIPPLAGLASLSYFIAWGNTLSGSIPSLDGLTQLLWFDLTQNQLSGSIPSLTGLTSLGTFMVSMNQLSGPIPPLAHQGIDALMWFVAYQNQLTGSIPSLEGLSNLQYFSVHDNRLTGSLPAFSGQSLDRLTQFEAERNQLTGSIPDLGGSNMYILTLNANALTGSLPAIPATLYQFDASDNHLTGPIPDLSNATALRGFNVGFNDLSGTLPAPAPRMDPNPDVSSVSVCPNHLTHTSSPAWDAVVGYSPWYGGCAGTYVDPNQFGFTGAWYDTNDPGKGFLIDAMPDHVAPGVGTYFGGWFNFPCGVRGCPNGTSNDQQAQQQWFSFQDDVDATNAYSRLTVYESRNGNFDALPAVGATPVGMFSLAFDDCSHGIVRYHVPNGGIYPDRTVRVTRLTPNTRCTQDAAPAGMPVSNTLLSGAWYDPTTAGQGLVFDINAENGVLFAAWYTFALDGVDVDPAASQRWYTLQALAAADTRTFAGVTIYDTTGGIFDAAWPPAQSDFMTTAPVGSTDITFQSCSTLTIDYRFTAGENAGRTGTLHLARLSPVPAGCVD